MAKPIDQWLETTVAKYQDYDIEKMSHLYFFRDPPRPQIVDPELFFAPADGVLLYQKIVKDDATLLEVKGEEYTIQDLMQLKTFDQYPCLVIGVFMTFFDVHINRVPYSGRLNYEYLEPIKSQNLPMLLVEKSLFDGKPEKSLEHLQYLKLNERVLNTVYSTRLDYTYYIVQIADKDVSAIMPFEQDQNEMFAQNERFSFIRWGSQVDLILPLDARYEFKVLNDTTDHVQAGMDALVWIKNKRKRLIY
jgi:phosphatidylserine decarboxylase